MNIDELNTNTDTEVQEASDDIFATPVADTPASAPAPTVEAQPETPAPVQTEAPAEVPATPVETPATTPVEATPTEAPAEVPSEAPVQTAEAPAADIPAPAAQADTPVDAPVDTLSPEAPKTEEMPEEPPKELFNEPVPTLEEIIEHPTNVSEINTSKRKGGEGVLVLCVIIFAAFAYFMGDIIGFIEPLFKSTNPVIESNSTGDSAVNGFLKIDDGVSEKSTYHSSKSL